MSLISQISLRLKSAKLMTCVVSQVQLAEEHELLQAVGYTFHPYTLEAIGGHKVFYKYLGMNANPYPTDLADAEWDRIKTLIPPPKPGGRPRALEMRAVVNAIFLCCRVTTQALK